MQQRQHEFDHAAAAAAAIAKNPLCLAGQCWVVAATYSEYAYAQRQMLWNFGFMGIISLPWWRYYWCIDISVILGANHKANTQYTVHNVSNVTELRLYGYNFVAMGTLLWSRNEARSPYAVGVEFARSLQQPRMKKVEERSDETKRSDLVSLPLYQAGCEQTVTVWQTISLTTTKSCYVINMLTWIFAYFCQFFCTHNGRLVINISVLLSILVFPVTARMVVSNFFTAFRVRCSLHQVWSSDRFRDRIRWLYLPSNGI